MKEDQKIVIYQTPDGRTQIDVRLEDETVWLNVAQMASLFTKEESNVRRHVSNAFKDGAFGRVQLEGSARRHQGCRHSGDGDIHLGQ